MGVSGDAGGRLQVATGAKKSGTDHWGDQTGVCREPVLSLRRRTRLIQGDNGELIPG